MTYCTIKQREADPSVLTVAELLAGPVQAVLDAALADAQAAGAKD